MRNGAKGKFRAEDRIELRASKRRARHQYWKVELIMGITSFSVLISYATIAGGWKSLLLYLGAIGLLYLLISATLEHIALYQESQEHRIEDGERRLISFICEATLGRAEKENLRRLAGAAGSITGRGREDDLSVDDFDLINRTWYFWSNGLAEQASTVCVNCQHERREHSIDGTCPTGASPGPAHPAA